MVWEITATTPINVWMTPPMEFVTPVHNPIRPNPIWKMMIWNISLPGAFPAYSPDDSSSFKKYKKPRIPAAINTKVQTMDKAKDRLSAASMFMNQVESSASL